MKYFTADWHLGHANIIEYCGRPFSSVEEMNETIIENCRRALKPKDDLFILGDVSLKPYDYVFPYLDKIPGKIHIIPGNHDRWINKYKSSPTGKIIIHDAIHIVRENKIAIFLCHYPMRRWYQCHRDTIHLYGHVHGNLDGHNRSLDVGVDCWDFKPVSLSTIIEKLEEKS